MRNNDSQKKHIKLFSPEGGLLFVTGSLELLAAILLTSVISFALKFHITRIQIGLSVILVAANLLFLIRIQFGAFFYKLTLKLVITMLAVFAICLALASPTIDVSFDGQGYHQATIIALNKGWNPLHEKIKDRKDIKLENTLWVDAYPQANDIISLNIYKYTRNVEAAKGVTLFLIILSLISSFIFLKKYDVHPWSAGLLVTLLVLNPVNVMQVFTFGLDSQFYSLIIIFASLLGIYIKENKTHIISFGILSTLILIINNKLTSIIYMLIFAGFISLWLLVNKKLYKLLDITFLLLVSLLLGVLFIGYHPFVTNFKEHHSLFYPVVVDSSRGDKAYDFTENKPSNKKHVNQFLLFPESLFFASNGEFRAPADKSMYRIPFSFKTNELNSLIQLGPKQGGFGVLFSGIVSLLLLLLAISIFYKKTFKGNKKAITLALLLTLLVVSMCSVNPLNNVARYIPQLWVIIPIILWVSWHFRSRLIFILSTVIVVTTIINSLMILSVDAQYNIKNTISINRRLRELSMLSESKAITVNFGQSEGNEFLLRRFNVTYVEDTNDSSEFKCPNDSRKELLMGGNGSSTSLACL